MKHVAPRRALVSGAVAILGFIGMIALPSSGLASADGHAQIKHVLLISVDGMHQSDLNWYVGNHPNSELARLATAALNIPTHRPLTRRTPIRAALGS